MPALPGAVDPATTAWCFIGREPVFLDLCEDRYFRLDESEAGEFAMLVERRELVSWHQPAILKRPDIDREARLDCAGAIGAAPFSLLARALFQQFRAASHLRRRGLFQILCDLRAAVEAAPSHSTVLSAPAGRLVRAHDRSRLIRTAANRCLPNSVALVSGLAALGSQAQLVIGVRLAPFGAHCWVQQGAQVLNETVEEVQRYRPILAI